MRPADRYHVQGSSIDQLCTSRSPVPERAFEAATSRTIPEVKADLFRALAHPTRIRALEVLAEGERSVGALLPEVGVEASNLSQQLAVLRRAGLVTTRKEGSSVIYAVRDQALVELLAAAKRVLINSLTETKGLLEGLEVGSQR
jgi:DNA-binding transcriptional ArsR family regulator